MKIVIDCPTCGKMFRVSREHAGRRAACNSCGTRIRIPDADDPLAADDPLSPSKWLAPAPRKPVGWQRQPLIILVAAGAAASVAVIVGILLLFFVRGASAPDSAVQEPALVSGPAPDDPRFAPPATQPHANAPNRSLNSRTTSAAGSIPEEGAKWGGPSVIPCDEDGSDLTFGPIGCPVLVSGERVWNIEERRIVAELRGAEDLRTPTALSPNGHWFAGTYRSTDGKETTLFIWNAQTGERLHEIPAGEQLAGGFMQMTNDKLFIGWRIAKTLAVYDIVDGAQTRAVDIPDGFGGPSIIGLSRDGKYVACRSESQLEVRDTESGQTVSIMGPPKQMESPPPGMSDKRILDGWAKSSTISVFAQLRAVEFSPDGQELAILSTEPKDRLTCWNHQGELVFDELLKGDAAFEADLFQWFPSRRAWLLGSDVLDRETGLVVLSIRKRRFTSDLRVQILDDDHLVGTFPHAPAQVEVLPIPWERIWASVKHMHGGGPALLSPLQPVSIRVELGSVRGSQRELIQAFQQKLAERLGQIGLRAEPGHATYFRIRFAEEAGDRLPIYERRYPMDFRGRDTGRTATEAKGSIIVDLMVPGQSDPIWRESLVAVSDRSFESAINDATVRQSMLDKLIYSLSGFNFPYFIPEPKDMVALPLMVR